MWLSIEKKFLLDVKDVERYLACKEMCEIMCPGDGEEIVLRLFFGMSESMQDAVIKVMEVTQL